MLKQKLGTLGCLLVVLILSPVQTTEAKIVTSAEQIIAIENKDRQIGYQPDMEEAIYQKVNELRASAGLKSLVWNDEMDTYSRRRAVEIIDDFSHDSIGGEMNYAENIAEGYTSVDEVTEAWMNSEDHRFNILCDYYKSISVSVYYNGRSYYYVQNFDIY
jgi:uncharacterized protein YkwD